MTAPQFALILALLAACCTFTACGPEEDPQAEAKAQFQAQLEALEQEQAALDELRDELEAKRDQLDAIEDGETPEGEGEPVDPETLAAEIDQLAQEIEIQTEDLGTKVVELLNSDPPVEGVELSESQRRAIALKAEEDMLVAETYIDRGGDYGRAIQIYQELLNLDPRLTQVQEAMEQAEAMRYITQERFDRLEEGMTLDEVKEALGPVNLRNIREYPDQDVIAWFYPKNDQGAAAAVYFRPDRGSEHQVYKWEWEVAAGDR